MNLLTNTLAILIMAYFSFLIAASEPKGREYTLPHIQINIDFEKIKQNQRLYDLYSIALALERYKTIHSKYPVKIWSALIAADGSLNENWVPELVPKYIDRLPRDPRYSSNPVLQYGYWSNGANYKLLANYPDDCISVRDIYPELVVPYGDCIAYGFWSSPNAVY